MNQEMERALAGERKGTYVSQMFGRIAPHYDLMNRLMSLGQDQVWRQRMATLADPPLEGKVLDLATGTGDVALAVQTQRPAAQVIGADFAVPMMRMGQRKPAPLRFVAADALALPFPDGAFDAVLHAFLMRNIAEIGAGFREQWRVLKPGGRVVCLEITSPSSPVARLAYSLFFESLVPYLGAQLSGDEAAYSYLPQSVRRFPDPEALSQMMRAAGFEAIQYERQMLGSIAIHVGRKPLA